MDTLHLKEVVEEAELYQQMNDSLQKHRQDLIERSVKVGICPFCKCSTVIRLDTESEWYEYYCKSKQCNPRWYNFKRHIASVYI